MYKELFHSRIKEIRKRKHYTQKEVAEETGLSQSQIALIESGRREPNLETIGLLIDFYEISADWVFGTNPKNII